MKDDFIRILNFPIRVLIVIVVFIIAPFSKFGRTQFKNIYVIDAFKYIINPTVNTLEPIKPFFKK